MAPEGDTTDTTNVSQGDDKVEFSDPMLTMTKDEMTETEVASVEEMMKSLSAEEAAAFPDDHMALRHLRAEKGNVTKAIKCLQATLQWRKEFGVSKILHSSSGHPANDMTDIIAKENETCKMYVRGYDKDGRALMYMRPGRENTKDMMDNMRHLVWNLEKAIACSGKEQRSKVCIVIDYAGFDFRHAPPLSTSRYTLDILQKHYPERMHRAYICNPPFLFRAFWAMVRPFVDPVTKSKICFCHGSSGMAKIVEDMGGAEMANHHLEACAGGTGTLREVDSKEFLQLPFNVAFDEKTAGTSSGSM